MSTLKNLIKEHIPIFIIKHFRDYYQKKLFKKVWTSKEQKWRHLDLLIDTNNVCNLKCIYCYTLNEEKKEARFMTLDEFKYIAKNLFPFSKTAALSCAAEPTLSKHFAEFIEISGTYNIPQISFVTNGLLLNEEIIIQSILSKIKLVTVSIDAADKEMYEFIRVNGEFDKVINNLKLIRDLKIKYSSKLPKIQIQYTVFDHNIDQSVDFVNKFHELFDTFFFSHLSVKKGMLSFNLTE